MKDRTDYPSTVLRDIERLRAIDVKLESAMKSLDRFHRIEVDLSVDEAKNQLARSRAFVEEAIWCLRNDHGLGDG